MPSWAATMLQTLWGNALTAVPLALAVAVACKLLPCRPWTRHTLWLLVLGWLAVPPILPPAPSGWLTAVSEPAVPALEGASSPSSITEFPKPATAASAASPAPPVSSAIAHGGPDADSSDPASAAVATYGRGGEGEKRRGGDDGSRLDALNKEPVAGLVVVLQHEPAARPIERAQETLVTPPADRAELLADTESNSDWGPSAVSTTRVDPPEDAAAAPAAWRIWLAGLVRVRDAFLALSPIPGSVWLGGITAVLLVRLACIAAFSRRLRSAWPASGAVTRMVKRAAADLGLSSAPEVAMIRQRLSPMIWCPPLPGRKQLLLPAGLWNELDDLGRKAVIYHELAHLRRRDHWVCWLQLLVGSVFWWHPVSWWANRRVREEADYCCDAWVTWLLPRGRRAYAEALLRARVHASNAIVPVPAVGMGAGATRSNRFARRISMVMTESIRPRFSGMGLALAAVLAMAGWAAVPARSCPPNETTPDCKKVSKPAKAAKAPKAPKPPKTTKPPKAPLAPQPPVPPEPPESDDDNTYERHVRPRAPRAEAWPAPSFWGVSLPAPPGTAPLFAIGQAGRESESDLEKRLERLERQLERLAARLEEMADRPRTPRPERPERPERPRRPEPTPAPPGRGPEDSGETVPRAYKLPSGKLEALTKLMSRQDVPIRVRPGDKEIEVLATPAQHEVFHGFMDLIDGGKTEVRAYRLPKGKLADLTALMVRSDVPILVQPSEDEIRVHATPAQHERFKAFVDLLEGSPRPGSAAGEPAPDAMRVRQELERVLAAQQRASAAETAAQAQELAALAREHGVKQAVEARALTEALRQQVRELQAQVRDLEREAENLSDQADQLEEQADELNEQAEQLREQAESIEQPEQAGHLRAQAQHLEAQSEVVRHQAEAVREQARGLEETASKLDAKADELDERADRADDALVAPAAAR